MNPRVGTTTMNDIRRILMILVLVEGASCATSKAEAQVATPSPGTTTPTSPIPRGKPVAASVETAVPKLAPSVPTIYFEFDSSALSSESRSVLNELTAYLRDVQGAMASIAGHADDRGTVEYNLALGQRRAVAVRDYLMWQGIAANRLHTISYGEARPVALGQDEESWAQNRRDEVTVVSTAVAEPHNHDIANSN